MCCFSIAGLNRATLEQFFEKNITMNFGAEEDSVQGNDREQGI